MSKNFKKSIIYSLEPIISKGLTFILIPLYTAYLTIGEYGTLQYVMSLAAFIRIFTQVGTNSAFWKFSNDRALEDNGEILKNLVFLQILFGGIVLALLLIITLILNYEFNSWLLFLYFGSLIIKTFSEILLLQFRYNGFAVKYLATTISTLLLNISITIYFVVYLGFGALGIVYSYLITFIIIGFYALPALITHFKGLVSVIKIKELIKFGTPLMLGNIFLLFISLSDRWFILKMLNEEQLGYYSYVYKFSDLTLTFLVYSFNIIFVPIMWRAYKINCFNVLFHKIEKNLLIIFPIISLIIVLISIFLANFFTMNNDYILGFNLILLLSFSHIFYGFYLFQILKIQMFSNTKSVIIITAVAATLNFILNFLLIGGFGILGAGISTFFSYLVLMFFIEMKCAKIHPTLKNNFNYYFCILLIILIAFSSVKLFDLFEDFRHRIIICFLYIIAFLSLLVIFKITTYRSLKNDLNYIFVKSDKV
tara:strand:- start:4289 stop:5728 length:1440 start_codon:yes stop_codon:yes gene_type:complete